VKLKFAATVLPRVNVTGKSFNSDGRRRTSGNKHPRAQPINPHFDEILQCWKLVEDLPVTEIRTGLRSHRHLKLV
jgi:hypothetical protein